MTHLKIKAEKWPKAIRNEEGFKFLFSYVRGMIKKARVAEPIDLEEQVRAIFDAEVLHKSAEHEAANVAPEPAPLSTNVGEILDAAGLASLEARVATLEESMRTLHIELGGEKP